MKRPKPNPERDMKYSEAKKKSEDLRSRGFFDAAKAVMEEFEIQFYGPRGDD